MILVSGAITGQAVETSQLREAKNAVGETPVFANTGVNIDNAAEILKIGDGAVVGTHFKVDGDTWKAVDPSPRGEVHGKGAQAQIAA